MDDEFQFNNTAQNIWLFFKSYTDIYKVEQWLKRERDETHMFSLDPVS